MTTDKTFRSIELVSRYCASVREPEEEDLNDEDLALIEALQATPDAETWAWLDARGVDHQHSFSKVLGLVLTQHIKPPHRDADMPLKGHNGPPGQEDDNVIPFCAMETTQRHKARPAPREKSAFPSLARCTAKGKSCNDNHARTMWRQVIGALWLAAFLVVGVLSFSDETPPRAPAGSAATAEASELRQIQERLAALQADVAQLEARHAAALAAAKALEEQTGATLLAIRQLDERRLDAEQAVLALDARKRATEQLLATLEERQQAAERTSQLLATMRVRALKVVQAQNQGQGRGQGDKLLPEKEAAAGRLQVDLEARYGAYVPVVTGSFSLAAPHLHAPAFEASPLPAYEWRKVEPPARLPASGKHSENKLGPGRVVLDF